MVISNTLKQLDDAIALFKPVHDISPPQDPFERPRWNMAGAHALFMISLKHMYSTASRIRAKDYDDFVRFALFWVSLLEHHHHIEEDWFFDSLKGCVATSDIKGEHEHFTGRVHDLQVYLEKCLPAGTSWGCWEDKVPVDIGGTKMFSSNIFERLTEELVDAFVQHFCDEITYLTPERLRTTLTYEECHAVNERLEGYIISQPPAFHVWSILHRPSENFPPAPWFVKRILCPWVWYWSGRSMWRFAPQDPPYATV